MAATTLKIDRITDLLPKFSYWKILRITAWILRFRRNASMKTKGDKIQGLLTTEELDLAKMNWIKKTQKRHASSKKFLDDVERLNLQRDESDCYRCMGRIKGDYPIYLPADDLFTQRMIEYSHCCTLHGGGRGLDLP